MENNGDEVAVLFPEGLEAIHGEFRSSDELAFTQFERWNYDTMILLNPFFRTLL